MKEIAVESCKNMLKDSFREWDYAYNFSNEKRANTHWTASRKHGKKQPAGKTYVKITLLPISGSLKKEKNKQQWIYAQTIQEYDIFYIYLKAKLIK